MKIKFFIFALLSVSILLFGCDMKSEKESHSKTKESNITKSNSNTEKKEEVKENGLDQLENRLDNQDLIVEDSKYLIRSEELKSLYPDALQAFIRNNTDKDIKDITFGFVAWDKNGLPIKIKQAIDFSEGAYFRGVKGEAVNIASADLYGQDTGMEIKEGMDVEYFKPIVVSYEDFEGNNWENKELDNFLEIYEGKRLKDIEGYEQYIYYKNN